MNAPAAIDPELKSWIDNVIVPALVSEFMKQEQCNDVAPELCIVAKSELRIEDHGE